MITHAHWLPRLISTAGKYDGAANKFLQGHILDHIVKGRIHAELHPFKTEDSGTRSFRFSYSEPPLQQIPKRDPEIMPLIRCCFLPEEGEVWATADANQQEFRIFVHEGARHGLPGAHEAAEFYRNDPNADFHKWVEELVQTDRTAAKGINFGNIYGAGLVKLAEMMRKTPEEAAPDHRGIQQAAAVREETLAALPERGRTHRLHRDAQRRPAALEPVRGGVQPRQGRRARAASKRRNCALPTPNTPGIASSCRATAPTRR